MSEIPGQYVTKKVSDESSAQGWQDRGDEQPIYTRHEWPHLPAPPPVVNRFDGLRAAVVALRDQLDRETLPPVAITLALSTILEQFPPSLIPAGVLGGEGEHHAILSGLLSDKAQLETEVQRLAADKERLLGALETALQEQDTLRAAQATRQVSASAAGRFRRTCRAWQRFLPYDQQLAIVTGLIAQEQAKEADDGALR